MSPAEPELPVSAIGRVRAIAAPVIGLGRFEEMRREHAIEAFVRRRGSQFICARRLVGEHPVRRRRLHALMCQRGHHPVLPDPATPAVLLHPDDEHLVQRGPGERGVPPVLDQGGADATAQPQQAHRAQQQGAAARPRRSARITVHRVSLPMAKCYPCWRWFIQPYDPKASLNVPLPDARGPGAALFEPDRVCGPIVDRRHPD